MRSGRGCTQTVICDDDDMSDPYQTAKGGRLTFKGGVVATRSKKIDKKKKKKAKHNKDAEFQPSDVVVLEGDAALEAGEGGGEGGEPASDIYTIDAAKKMKYEELFPVETRKFGYDPDNNKPNFKSVEDALDDRVKKKADRYCK